MASPSPPWAPSRSAPSAPAPPWPPGPPATANVKAIGSGTFKINRYARDGTRFNRDVYTVRAGGSVRLTNTQTDEGPHTLTVLRRKDLPRTDAQINKCGSFQGSGPCQRIAAKHQPDEATGSFKTAVVNAGKAGIDQAGDSIAVTPKGAPGSSLKVKVSAKRGSTLYFVCLVHPWMQARLQVK